MTVIGILGGGFGLYGYLPASTECKSCESITLTKYQEKILKRSDLKNLNHKISYAMDETELIARSDVVIAARRPYDNLEIVKLIHNKKLIIEKPIAKTPAEAGLVLTQALKQGNELYSGFIFKYTEWYKTLKLKFDGTTNIYWSIEKRNAYDSWKYSIETGGGLLSFYGIHIVNLAAELNYHLLTVQTGENDRFLKLQFVKENQLLNVYVMYSDAPNFTIRGSHFDLDFSSETPFGNQNEPGKPDNRIFFLRQLLDDVLHGSKPQNISGTISMWKDVLEGLTV